jgi:hypothetical protein
MLRERRGPSREIRGRAFDYHTQVELVMNAAQDRELRIGARKERFAIAAVLLAIAVSLGGACVVIVESSSQPRAQLSAAANE